MGKTKKGDVYCCEACGLVIEVKDPCTCDVCSLICCEIPMRRESEKKKSKLAGGKKSSCSKSSS